MIASLRGRIQIKEADILVLDVNGVGYEVFATRSTLDKGYVDDEIFVWTRMIVREDAMTLYGFSNQPERDMFDALLKVSGVGPRLALQILSNMTLDNLRSAVASEHPESLTRVPGIGQKTARKILLELKDKLPTGLDALPVGEFGNLNADVMDALIALGFSVVEAQSAIQALPMSAPQDAQERIRLCLQFLSR
jgi:Holliday junction DNA helicase RuvA